eukprot:CAMPEP_0205918426 /NCGR_PEP_ID=MMETSP1325-20131115/9787_1 /ASSEMBLY_ACC=CAM_ASM_000708 /TAXON_ID=236786 /ORGANISM="Florenciella sp., Strain RCC1007" /LENGTH=113 /DNA_ID=CAMNT_0053285953 /DNA_START=663 /DNA_END=1000 /DNA_ORIENTATION=-
MTGSVCEREAGFHSAPAGAKPQPSQIPQTLTLRFSDSSSAISPLQSRCDCSICAILASNICAIPMVDNALRREGRRARARRGALARLVQRLPDPPLKLEEEVPVEHRVGRRRL